MRDNKHTFGRQLAVGTQRTLAALVRRANISFGMGDIESSGRGLLRQPVVFLVHGGVWAGLVGGFGGHCYGGAAGRQGSGAGQASAGRFKYQTTTGS